MLHNGHSSCAAIALARSVVRYAHFPASPFPCRRAVAVPVGSDCYDPA